MTRKKDVDWSVYDPELNPDGSLVENVSDTSERALRHFPDDKEPCPECDNPLDVCITCNHHIHVGFVCDVPTPDDAKPDARCQIIKFLDPRDRTVAWKTEHGKATTDGVLRYLREVLKRDLFDLLRRKAHRTTVIIDSQPRGAEQQDDPPRSKSLDDFATSMEGQDAHVLRQEQHARLLARLEDEPELRDVLAAQLDPDGYQAHTNQDLAGLLGTSVSEIENRKKRLDRRLLRIHAEMQKAPTRGPTHA